MKRTIAATAFVLAFAALVSGTPAAAQDFHQEYALGAGGKISIRNGNINSLVDDRTISVVITQVICRDEIIIVRGICVDVGIRVCYGAPVWNIFKKRIRAIQSGIRMIDPVSPG